MSDLWRAGAVELAERIKAGDMSARDVVEAHLARMDAVNGAVNAVVRRFDDQALAEADAADASRTAGEVLGPLHGVPITLKENVHMQGQPTTFGVPMLADNVPAQDEPAVGRLRAAGAIVIGRTNLPDMGLRIHTDSGLYGPTVNPWAPTRTPGGSSGGEAAALATGMSPLGVGNDYCGSLRWPSQACGVATLKPTLGAIPRAPLAATQASADLMMVHGPMARRIEDLRVAYSLMAGPHPCDGYSVTVPPLDAPHPFLAQKTIKVATNPGNGGVHPDVLRAVEDAANLLEAAGWQVEEGEPPEFEDAVRLWTEINGSVPTAMTGDMIRSLFTKDAMTTMALWKAASDYKRGEDAFALAMARRSDLLRVWESWFETHGLWLAPTATDQPFSVGDDLGTPARMAEILNGHRVIMATNALCLPSVVLPMGVAGGLPQSVQLIGPRFSEGACLDAAEAIEQATYEITPIDPKG